MNKTTTVYAFDLETNELLPKVTEVHSLVIRNAWNDELLFSGSSDADPTRPNYREGFAVLEEADILLAHNGIGFDYPVLEKLDGWTPRKEAKWDTQVLMEHRFTDQKDRDYNLFRKGKLDGANIGKHSLEAWGQRLGFHKLDYDGGWEQWSEEMQVYCEGDVGVLGHLWRYAHHCGIVDEAVRTEMRLAEYLHHQQVNGFPFNQEKAEAFSVELEKSLVPLKVELREYFGQWYTKRNGYKVIVPKRTMNRKDGLITEGCAYSKIKVEEFNPGSDKQVVEALQRKYGWKPTVMTEKGNPQFDEAVIKALPYPEREPLLKWAKVKKIQSMLEGGTVAWMKMVGDDGHMHGRVKQSGTITHRATHSSPNMGQVPSVDNEYGAECRGLFGPPAGWVQVGIDVSGLENVMLAHYAAKFDGGEFTEYVKAGDTHTAGMNAGGFTDHRPTFKTWWYAWLYGAGDEKLGKILGKGIKAGKESRAKFTEGMRGLGLLIADLAKIAKQGWFRLLDRRMVSCRSQHAALNTLLQGSGSVFVKYWIVALYEELLEKFGPPSWEGRWSPLVWVHDEIQLASRDDEVTEFLTTRGVELIALTGESFNLRCPITGEAKTGSSWASCH